MKEHNLKYHNEMHYLCMKSAFSQMLDLMGIEDYLLYLRVGNELKLKKENDKISIYTHFQLMPFHNMQRVKSGKGNDFENVFKQNIKDLPLIVMCDVFYLPYRREFGKHHAMHAIILSNYNSAERKVEVIDWYEPHFFYDYISIEDFKKARSSCNPKDLNMFSGYSVENYWYKVEGTSSLLSIKDNYDRNVHEMTKSVVDTEKNIYWGIYAINEIKKSLNSLHDASGDVIKAVMGNCHDEMFVFFRTNVFGTLYYDKAYKKLLYSSALEYMNFCSENVGVLEKLNTIFLKGSMRPISVYVHKAYELLEKLEENYIKIEKKQ